MSEEPASGTAASDEPTSEVLEPATEVLEPATAGEISPQVGGWFLLLLVVGALVSLRYQWTQNSRTQKDSTTPLHGVHYVVDINQAEEAELLNLPEIGPSLAKRILMRRAELGEFRDLDELRSVPGIGPQTAKQLAPFLHFSFSATGQDSATAASPVAATSHLKNLTQTHLKNPTDRQDVIAGGAGTGRISRRTQSAQAIGQ